MSTAATIAEFELELRRAVKRLLAEGIPRQALMRLLIDQAHEAVQTGPGDGRRSAEAVLEDAIRLYSLFDDPDMIPRLALLRSCHGAIVHKCTIKRGPWCCSRPTDATGGHERGQDAGLWKERRKTVVLA